MGGLSSGGWWQTVGELIECGLVDDAVSLALIFGLDLRHLVCQLTRRCLEAASTPDQGLVESSSLVFGHPAGGAGRAPPRLPVRVLDDMSVREAWNLLQVPLRPVPLPRVNSLRHSCAISSPSLPPAKRHLLHNMCSGLVEWHKGLSLSLSVCTCPLIQCDHLSCPRVPVLSDLQRGPPDRLLAPLPPCPVGPFPPTPLATHSPDLSPHMIPLMAVCSRLGRALTARRDASTVAAC